MLDDSRAPSAPPARSGALASSEAEIVVRPITARLECEACVSLQHEIWGPGHGDAVPSSLLQVVPRVGGLVAGAFAADGELVGFVFGLPALVNGTFAHWSHILGVRESARNAGVGRMLKEFQRAELARRGIGCVYWTYDPLIARSAHLNLTLLGARVVEYVRDMYGTTTSPLHNGLATDRLVVACDTTPPPHVRAAARAQKFANCSILTAEPRAGDVLAAEADHARTILLEIPADFQLLAASEPVRAAMWHAAARMHFERALYDGYSVTGLHRDPVASRAFYIVELAPPEAAT
ncbi:MAG: hypothetical protein H0U66_06690 [Gemmatimonadaceae bacterium]|nr:hypothetical protein [Gemmatimonadaceae bacterium]